MLTSALDAKRMKFRSEVVEPHLVVCSTCQRVLVEKEELLAALAGTRFPVKEVENMWDWLNDTVLDTWGIAQRDWFIGGVYYLADEAACTVYCSELDILFNDYFATL